MSWQYILVADYLQYPGFYLQCCRQTHRQTDQLTERKIGMEKERKEEKKSLIPSTNPSVKED